MSKKLKVVLGVVLALVLVGALIFAFVLGKDKGKDDSAGEVSGSPVSFTVNAQGWSEETSSPIPIQVTGETEDKERVDEKYFLGASDKDLVLKPGTYEAEVYASPVNADGGMYRCPKAVKLSVPKATSKPQSKPSASESASAGSEPVASVELELSPVPANEITDEEIEKAQAAMKDAGLSEEEINTFVETARTARQAELDRIESERVAKEREALGMYPGAGGPRPAGARLMTTYLDDHWIINSAYAHCSSATDSELRNTGGVWCFVFNWKDVSPAGEAYYESPDEQFFGPSGIEPVNQVNFDSDGNASLDIEHPTGIGAGNEVKAGEAWYYGDHVFGATSSGLTYWNSRTGKGAFISKNAYVPF